MSVHLSLHERFSNAEVFYNARKDWISQHFSEPKLSSVSTQGNVSGTDMKLYGLYKQSKEGNCHMPMPPRYDLIDICYDMIYCDDAKVS
jgi:hypothetical protein